MNVHIHTILLLATLAIPSTPAAAKEQPPRIERFARPGVGSVNTYIVDAPEGLIVIDFQRDTESAEEAVARVESRRRPVVALLVTHAHPDHIGGLAQFKKAFPGAPIYASQETAQEIASDSMGFQKLARSALGARAPAGYPHAEKIIASGAAMTLAGLRVESLEMGPGESISTTVFYVPSARALFAADLVIEGMTDFLMEGRTGPWLRQLDTLQRGFPATERLYPGHGAPGPAKRLIREQGVFLGAVRSAVAKRSRDGRLTRDAQSEILKELEGQFGARLPWPRSQR